MRAILTVVLALFLPLSSLSIVMSEPVCRALADASIVHSEQDPQKHEELVEVALAVREFSLGNDNAALPLGTDYREALTPDALSHLLDVRTVFLALGLALAVLLVLVIALLYAGGVRRGPKFLVFPLILGGAIPLAAALLLGGAIALDFTAFFTWMHGIFFADGTWTFPYDSLLIQSLPYDFWLGCAIVWAGSMIVLCLLSIGIGLVLSYLSKRAEKALDEDEHDDESLARS